MTLINDEIKADFAAFADPATLIEVKDRDISWTQSGERRTARLSPSDRPGFPNIRYLGIDYGYRQFFASTHMADLRAVAETQIRVMRLPPYVDSTVEINEAEHLGLDALKNLIQPKSRSRTSVIFLQGEAGTGKTTLLKQLSIDLAGGFTKGANDYLTLYVDAQNRSLARLDEAVATVLQDTRAKFTYHALATLARIDLVVPIIDGFDELLGARGYEDALSSLLRFLERLSGEGVVITSARSSFYRFQSMGWLHRGSSSTQLDFEVTIATILNWTDDQIEKAIDSMDIAEEIGLVDAHEVLVKTKSAIAKNVWQLFSIPFLVYSFYDMVKGLAQQINTSQINTNQDDTELTEMLPELLGALARQGIGFLANGLIVREVPKLKGRDDHPLLVRSDHDKFLQEVAEEMWMQEVRILDRSSVEALLEMVVENEGKATLFEVLRGRASVHPLLISAGNGGLGFRHELFFSYFMARVLLRYFEAQDPKFSRVLGRSMITTTTADEFVKPWFISAEVESNTGHRFSEAQKMLDQLAAMQPPPSLRTTVRRNAGELVAAAIRFVGVAFTGKTILDIAFERADLRGSNLIGARLVRCELDGIDLREAQWTNVDLSESNVLHLLLSKNTELKGVILPKSHTLNSIIYDDEKIFEPSQIVEILKQLGCQYGQSHEAVELSPVQKRRVNLVRRLVRATDHTLRFSNDDLQNAGIIRDPEWRLLERLLDRHKLLETERVQRRGVSGNLRRFAVSTDEIEEGVGGHSANSRIAAFWSEFLFS